MKFRKNDILELKDKHYYVLHWLKLAVWHIVNSDMSQTSKSFYLTFNSVQPFPLPSLPEKFARYQTAYILVKFRQNSRGL